MFHCIHPLHKHFWLNKLRFCSSWARDPQVRSQGKSFNVLDNPRIKDDLGQDELGGEREGSV